MAKETDPVAERTVPTATKKGIVMKKKFISLALTAALILSFAGCGSKNVDTDKKTDVENTSTGTDTGEDSSDEDINLFSTLSKYSYSFSSGAGGWSTELYIEKNGDFHGMYHDSEMGAIGDDYPGGEYYFSSFSGTFTGISKIDDLTYELTYDEINYKNEVGTTEIIDGMKYIYSEAYGLAPGTTFKVYLPGTEVSTLSEEVMSWVHFDIGDAKTLETPVIENVDEMEAFSSWERLSAKEEAEMELSSYKTSYDYYNENLQNAMTTLDMSKAANSMYKAADDCLNSIWTIVKYNVSEDEFASILDEQRNWINEKEAKIKELSTDSGSLGPVDASITAADMTFERCEKLIEYLN